MSGPIVDLAIRSTVLFAGAGLVAVLVRTNAAAIQSLVVTLALAGSLVLPAAVWMGPALEVPVLQPAVDGRQVGATVTPSEPSAGTASRSTLATSALSNAAAEPPPSVSVVSSATRGAAPSRRLVSPASALSLAWVLGFLLVVARLLRSHILLGGLIRRSQPATDPEWLDALDAVRSDLVIARPVSLVTSAELSVPIVAGVLRPTVVFPDEAVEWPSPVLRDVIRHELAHVARWDAVGQLAGQIACAVYWFNPLAWALASRASTLRERACDDEVLRVGTRASEYAQRLLALVRADDRRAPRAAALAMASPARLRARVIRVLDPSARRERPGRSAIMTALLTAGAVVLSVGSVQPVARAASSVPSIPAAQLTIADFGTSPQHAPRIDVMPYVAPTAGKALAPNGSQATPALCEGRLSRSSSSINDNGSERHWRVILQGPGCDIDLRVDGQIEFNADFTDVARLDADGLVRLDATTDGVRRHLELRNRNGALVRTYEVDGRTAQWDGAAQSWFARFLIALDRRTAVAVDIRLPILLRQGGVAAVLAETAVIGSDHARSRYYAKLIDSTRLSADERLRLIEQAASLTESDHYAADVLTHVVSQGRLEDPRERDAAVAMMKKMDSDHYRAEVMKMLAGAPLSSAQASALLDVLSAMDSDHYRHEVLTSLVAAAPADLDLTTASAVIRQMDSDHYRAESVRAISRRTLNSSQVDALLPLVGDMDSDHYKTQVLEDLLKARAPEPTLLAAVRLIGGMDSDHYKAQSLGTVLANEGATDAVRTSVREVAETLSRAYREQLLRQIR